MSKQDDVAPLTELGEQTLPAKSKPPMTAYQLFVTETLPQIKAQNPTLQGLATMKLLADQWQKLTAADKKPYTDKAQQLKDEFQAQMDSYNKKDAPDTTIVPEPINQSDLETSSSLSDDNDDSESSDEEAETAKNRKKQKRGHE